MMRMQQAQRQIQRWTTSRTVFGAVVVARRAKLDLKRAEICKATGISQATMSRIERGETSVSLDDIIAISSAFVVLPSSLLVECEQTERLLDAFGIRVFPLPVSCGLALRLKNGELVVLRHHEDLNINDMMDVHELLRELRRINTIGGDRHGTE